MFETLRIGLVVAAIGVAGWMAMPATVEAQVVGTAEAAPAVDQAQSETYAGGERQRRRDGQGPHAGQREGRGDGQGPNAGNRQPRRDGQGPHGEGRRERRNEDCRRR